MLAIKRSAGVTSEMNMREHSSHTPLQSVNKAAHFGLGTQRRHSRSPKLGYQRPHKRTRVHQNLKKCTGGELKKFEECDKLLKH